VWQTLAWQIGINPNHKNSGRDGSSSRKSRMTPLPNSRSFPRIRLKT